MPTIELNEVFELQSERVSKVGTNAKILFGPGHKGKNDVRVVVIIAELQEISSMSFAVGARMAKKYREVSELEIIWNSVSKLCDRAEALAKRLIKKAHSPVSIEDIERIREAAQFRAALYRKPA